MGSPVVRPLIQLVSCGSCCTFWKMLSGILAANHAYDVKTQRQLRAGKMELWYAVLSLDSL